MPAQHLCAQAHDPNLPVQSSFELCQQQQTLVSDPGHDAQQADAERDCRSFKRRAHAVDCTRFDRLVRYHAPRKSRLPCSGICYAALLSFQAAATARCLGCGGSRNPRMPSVPLNFISASYRYLTIPMDGATCRGSQCSSSTTHCWISHGCRRARRRRTACQPIRHMQDRPQNTACARADDKAATCLHVAEQGPAPQGPRPLLPRDDLECVRHVPVPQRVAGRSLDLRNWKIGVIQREGPQGRLLPTFRDRKGTGPSAGHPEATQVVPGQSGCSRCMGPNVKHPSRRW